MVLFLLQGASGDTTFSQNGYLLIWSYNLGKSEWKIETSSSTISMMDGFSASSSLVRRWLFSFVFYSDQDGNLGKCTFTFSKTSCRLSLRPPLSSPLVKME